MRFLRGTLPALVFAVFASAGLQAGTQRALLVGVGEYQDRRLTLLGPPHDVAALREELTGRLGFPADQVEALVDGQATRANILDSLARLRDASQSGDFVLLYLSGHGTSAYDAAAAGLALPTNTGAFVPHDYAAQGDAAQKLASLLLGYRDLRPVLAALDGKGVSGMVLIDSCYARNSSRSLHAAAPLAWRQVTSGLEHLEPFDGLPQDAGDRYPYRHLATLTASGAKEKALDLQDGAKTLDGKPHGAFTDAVLRTLRDAPNADANGDAALTAWEFFTAVKRRMGEADMPHSPQFLPPPGEDFTGLAERTAFRATGSLPAPAEPGGDRLRILVDGPLPLVDAAIAETGALLNAADAHDLRVRRLGGAVHLLTSFGDSVGSFPSEAEAASALRQQPWIRSLVRELGQAQRSNGMRLRLRGETFEAGDELTIAAAPPSGAYLLVLDIAPSGEFRVLHPGPRDGFDAVVGSGAAPFRARVDAPFGIDHVVAAGFRDKPGFYDGRLLQGAVKPGAGLHRALLAALSDGAYDSVAVAKVVTVPRSAGAVARR